MTFRLPRLFCLLSAVSALSVAHANPAPESSPTPAATSTSAPAHPAPVLDEAARKALATKQAKAASLLENKGNLITNGNFETPSHEGTWSKDWGSPGANLSRVEEDGKAFTRLKVGEPKKMVKLYRLVDLPEGTKALELNWRWRITDLERGDEKSNDARIILSFKDAEGKVISQRPNPPYFGSRNSKGWIDGVTKFAVPKGAVAMEIMPALHKANAGTLDVGDFVLKGADIRLVMAEVRAGQMPPDPPFEKAQPEKYPKPIRVEGNRLRTDTGEEVWLQGVNTAGLEWNPKGESILRRMLEAIEVWKANVIRLPIKSEMWNGPNKESYRALVDAAINLAANRGVYVVVDLHNYRAIKPEHVEFWKDFAQHYKNHPALLFDILNEPHSITWDVWRNGGFVEERKKKADEDAFLAGDESARAKEGFESPGMQAAVEAIRSTGAENVIVAGGLAYSLDLSGILKGYALEDKTGRGIMYATHVYNWHTDWQKNFLDVAAVHPILVGELGADYKKMEFIPAETQEDPATWVPDMLGVIQKYRLNWTGWCFHPNAGPRMLADWKFTPTPGWGELAKRALAGEKFETKKHR